MGKYCTLDENLWGLNSILRVKEVPHISDPFWHPSTWDEVWQLILDKCFILFFGGGGGSLFKAWY